jgi:hypothetical protein
MLTDYQLLGDGYQLLGDGYQLLGETIVREVMGVDFDPTFLLKAATEATEGGLKYKQQKDAEEHAKRDADAAVAKAIAADAAWANAEANAIVSKGLPTAAAAETLASTAAAGAMAAGAALSTEGAARRADAARSAATKAAEEAVSAPNDKGKQARMQAWSKVAAAASLGGLASGGGGTFTPRGGGEPSFLEKRYAGIPGWGWGLGALGIGALLLFTLRRR